MRNRSAVFLPSIKSSFFSSILCLSYLAVGSAQAKTLDQEAREMLAAYCQPCHKIGGMAGKRFGDILLTDDLIAKGYIKPFEPDESRIIQQIRAGNMPPSFAELFPGPAELAVLEKWIAEGAKAANPAASVPTIKADELLSALKQDLATLDAESDATSRVRYLDFSNLLNLGMSRAELAQEVGRVQAVLNSLSWKEDVAQLAAVRVEIGLYRLSLEDYGWDSELWESVFAAYPYDLSATLPAYDSVKAQLQSEAPMIRADFFSSKALAPANYQRILDLPTSAARLEGILGFSTAKNHAATKIGARRLYRAGFNESGVSFHNRVIERHETRNGYYWRSFDFASDLGQKSIFDFPLGPDDELADQGLDGFEASGFEPDGGEMIFSLPNGAQAYLIVNAKGERLDEAPSSIVFDPNRPPGTIRNGESCMGCHASGIITKDGADAVLQASLANDLFSAEFKAEVSRIYATQSEMNQVFEADRKRYAEFLKKAGIKGAAPSLIGLGDRYRAAVGLKELAAEIGLEAEELKVVLSKLSPALKAQIDRILHGPLARAEIERLFPKILEEAQAESLTIDPEETLSLTAGSDHTCLLKSGKISCWGGDEFGQSSGYDGNGVFTEVAAGTQFTCAISADSKLSCWGANFLKQPVPALRQPSRLAAGAYHICVQEFEQGVRCFGNDSFGQLQVPETLKGAKIRSIEAGDYHTCAIDEAGVSTCWGRNDFYQSDLIETESEIEAFALNKLSSCARLKGGSVQCWGDDRDGLDQVPEELKGVRLLSLGSDFACAANLSQVRCWGQIGDGSASSDIGSTRPVARAKALAAGDRHVCALNEVGLQCWGSNDKKQLVIPSNLK